MLSRERERTVKCMERKSDAISRTKLQNELIAAGTKRPRCSVGPTSSYTIEDLDGCLEKVFCNCFQSVFKVLENIEDSKKLNYFLDNIILYEIFMKMSSIISVIIANLIITLLAWTNTLF